MSGQNPNSVAREAAQKLREQGKLKEALDTLQRGFVPDSPGASFVQAEMDEIKLMLANQAIGARESEAANAWNQQVARVVAAGKVRPQGAPSDTEGAQIVRRYFAQFGDTQFAASILNAKPSENATYAAFQTLLRENPDLTRTDAQAVAELDAAVSPLTHAGRHGAAYERVGLSLQLERLTLSPEAFKKFEPRALARRDEVTQQARAELETVLRAARTMAQGGDRDAAKARVRAALGKLAWPEPDLQRLADDAIRGW
jgi:hypothetical protein